jgi:uncharacterized protein
VTDHDPSDGSDAHVRARNLEALRKAFEGVSAADADQMLEHYTEDLVMELPYTIPPTIVEGREEVRRYLRKAFKTYKFRIWITEVHPTIDPDMAVVEYASDGHIVTTGKVYANIYIGVYWFRDGRIRRYKEFFNPEITRRALKPD